MVTFSFIHAEFADLRVNFLCEQEVLRLSLSVIKTRDQDFQFCVFLCIRDFPFCELTLADRRKIPILLVPDFCEFWSMFVLLGLLLSISEGFTFICVFQFCTSVFPLWLNFGIVFLYLHGVRGNTRIIKEIRVWNELMMVFTLSNRQSKSTVNRHCRCFCILEIERTGSGECLLCYWLLFKQEWPYILMTRKYFWKSLIVFPCQQFPTAKYESTISLLSKTLSFWWGPRKFITDYLVLNYAHVWIDVLLRTSSID